MGSRTGEDIAAQVARVAREVALAEILPRFRRVPALEKPDGSVVTEADFAAQRALVASLQAIEPLPVIAEEMPAREQRAVFEAAPRFWCIDPLDGTKNFTDGVSLFSTSVALVEGGRPLLGAVYDPMADEAFHAARGAGAWLNGAPLVVPPRGPALRDALAEVSLRRETARLRGPLKRARPYARRQLCGSATLAWCHLAAARTDVLLHSGQKMWDYAAGALILEQAGGFLCGLHEDDYWRAPPWSRTAIAARTRSLFDEWRGWVRGTLAGAPAAGGG